MNNIPARRRSQPALSCLDWLKQRTSLRWQLRGAFQAPGTCNHPAKDLKSPSIPPNTADAACWDARSTSPWLLPSPASSGLKFDHAKVHNPPPPQPALPKGVSTPHCKPIYDIYIYVIIYIYMIYMIYMMYISILEVTVVSPSLPLLTSQQCRTPAMGGSRSQLLSQASLMCSLLHGMPAW